MADPEKPQVPPESTPAQTPLSAPPEPFAAQLFLNEGGLRVGWRLVLYVMLWLFLRAALGYLNNHVLHFASLRTGVLGNLTGETVALLSALLPAVLLWRLEKRPWSDYGLPLRGAFGRRFWEGALWGFVALSLLLFAIHLAHGFEFGVMILHGRALLRYAAFWALFFVVVAFAEDFLFRGYLQFTLAQGIGFWPAAFLLSTLFGMVHAGNSGENSVGLVSAGLFGLFACYTLWRTGNLWFAIGLHTAWDWGQSFFYSVPDSGGVAAGHLFSSRLHGPRWLCGGSVGPEGSAFIFLLFWILFVAFDRRFRDKKWGLAAPSAAPAA